MINFPFAIGAVLIRQSDLESSSSFWYLFSDFEAPKTQNIYKRQGPTLVLTRWFDKLTIQFDKS